jgi:hypothetical protein
MRYGYRLLVLTLALAGAVSAGGISNAVAKSRSQGYGTCVDWCNANNKTNASFNTCRIQCGCYWLKQCPRK